MKMKILLFLFGIALLAACTSNSDIEPQEIIDAGILPLSSTDPFVGANVFVAKEMERSSYLHHFVESHGAPDAIEVLDRNLEPLKVLLFYTKESAVYSMLPRQREKQRQWIIRGPFQMNWKDLKELRRLEGKIDKKPTLFVWGREVRYGTSVQQPVAKVIHPVIPPAPAPTPKKKVRKSVVKQKKVSEEEIARKRELALLTLDPKKFKPLNTDQQAILISKGYVERASNGDAVHTVRREDETLELLAKWYTKSATNAAAIAKANNLEPDSALLIGTTVSIPIGILKNIKVMPLTYQ